MPLPALGAAELAFIRKQLARKLPKDSEKRYRFLVLWQEGCSLSDLCEKTEISRPTAVLWKRAFLVLRDEHLDAVERFGRETAKGRPPKALEKIRDYLSTKGKAAGDVDAPALAKALHIPDRSVRRVLAELRRTAS